MFEVYGALLSGCSSLFIDGTAYKGEELDREILG
jgi:hypothetical protein